MFAKYVNLRNLERGIEASMTMNLFGLPEILIAHYKYAGFVSQKVFNLKKSHPTATLTILTIHPDWTCEVHAAECIKSLMRQRGYERPDMVTIRYFGIEQGYVNKVGKLLNVTHEDL